MDDAIAKEFKNVGKYDAVRVHGLLELLTMQDPCDFHRAYYAKLMEQLGRKMNRKEKELAVQLASLFRPLSRWLALSIAGEINGEPATEWDKMGFNHKQEKVCTAPLKDELFFFTIQYGGTGKFARDYGIGRRIILNVCKDATYQVHKDLYARIEDAIKRARRDLFFKKTKGTL